MILLIIINTCLTITFFFLLKKYINIITRIDIQYHIHKEKLNRSKLVKFFPHSFLSLAHMTQKYTHCMYVYLRRTKIGNNKSSFTDYEEDLIHWVLVVYLRRIHQKRSSLVPLLADDERLFLAAFLDFLKLGFSCCK